MVDFARDDSGFFVVSLHSRQVQVLCQNVGLVSILCDCAGLFILILLDSRDCGWILRLRLIGAIMLFLFYFKHVNLKHARLPEPSNVGLTCLHDPTTMSPARLQDPNNVGLAWLPNLRHPGLLRQALNQGGFGRLAKPKQRGSNIFSRPKKLWSAPTNLRSNVVAGLKTFWVWYAC